MISTPTRCREDEMSEKIVISVAAPKKHSNNAFLCCL